jgi:hypothetical protein
MLPLGNGRLKKLVLGWNEPPVAPVIVQSGIGPALYAHPSPQEVVRAFALSKDAFWTGIGTPSAHAAPPETAKHSANKRTTPSLSRTLNSLGQARPISSLRARSPLRTFLAKHHSSGSDRFRKGYRQLAQSDVNTSASLVHEKGK